MTSRKPTFVFDAACELCRRWVSRWQARTGDRVAYVPLQSAHVLRELGIAKADALAASQLVTPEGVRYRGADAVFRALAYSPELSRIARIGRFPIVRTIARAVYRWVAGHRRTAARIDRFAFGTTATAPQSRLVRDVYLRALGAVYLTAFASLGRQVKGLYGSHGIRPIADYLAALRDRFPARERMRLVPTAFWLDASDATLVRACRAGQLGAVMLMLGIAPRATATALWLLYLSFVTTGREFLAFQWDGLLLENGLHALALATGPRGERPPWTAVATMRWLAARLSLESGHCKLASGDRAWRSGDALCVHFETQPLPTPLAWHAHQLPRTLKRVATYATLAVELAAPWLAFAPRRLRHAAFALLTGLQAVIAATGNYGFFNLLAVADNLWLLDDSALSKTVRRAPRAPRWRRWLTALAAIPIAVLSSALVRAKLFPRARGTQALAKVHDAIAPLRSLNPYGLFAVMTTDRPEIAIEGSDDGITWHEYRFRYKPCDPQRGPGWVAPHQPRLDWQMWFAALRPAPPWFIHLLTRLLEGSPDVLALFGGNPFPDHPPRYVRALLYDYRMTDRATRKATGAWWRRDLLGLYVPPLQLDQAAIGSSTVTVVPTPG